MSKGSNVCSADEKNTPLPPACAMPAFAASMTFAPVRVYGKFSILSPSLRLFGVRIAPYGSPIGVVAYSNSAVTLNAPVGSTAVSVIGTVVVLNWRATPSGREHPMTLPPASHPVAD